MWGLSGLRKKHKFNVSSKLIILQQSKHKKVSWALFFFINCEAHCHKMLNYKCYISKTARDIKKFQIQINATVTKD